MATPVFVPLGEYTVMVGCTTLPTLIQGLPATGELVTTTVSFSGPANGCPSGAAPGQIKTCFRPGGGCQTGVCAPRMPPANKIPRATILEDKVSITSKTARDGAARPTQAAERQADFTKDYMMW